MLNVSLVFLFAGMGKRGAVARSSGDHFFFSSSSSLVDISPQGGPPMDSDSDEEFGESGWQEDDDIERVAGASEWSSYGDNPVEYGGRGRVEDPAPDAGIEGEEDEEDEIENYDTPNFTGYDAESEYHLSGLPDNYQWKSSAPRWEVPALGEIANRNPELEKNIFSHHLNAGINFKKYDDIPVQVTGSDTVAPITAVYFLFLFFSLFFFPHPLLSLNSS